MNESLDPVPLDQIEELEPLSEGPKPPSDYESALAFLGVYEKDLENKRISANRIWTESAGNTKEDMAGDKWLEKVHPEDRSRVAEVWSEVVRGGRSVFASEYRISDGQGGWLWVLNRAVILKRDGQGKPLHYIGVDIDITERKNIEAKLLESQRRAEEQAREAESLRVASAVLMSSLDFEEALQRILQQASNIIPSRRASIYIAQKRSFQLVADNVMKGKTAFFSFPPGHPCHIAMRTGELTVYEDWRKKFSHKSDLLPSIMIMPIRLQGETRGFMLFQDDEPGFFQLVHKRRVLSFADYVSVALQNAKIYNQVRTEASRDTLTGMGTRRWFMDKLDQILTESRDRNAPLSLMMMDLDHFKAVNDQYGHLIGDEVLVLLSNTVSNVLRSTDVCCRYGGEEFIVLLPDTGEEEAVNIAERLRREIYAICVPNTQQNISISIGVVSLVGEIQESSQEFIDRADKALYQAKDSGRNKVIFQNI